MGIGVRNDDVITAASIVGYSTFSPPFNYLGIKVGAAMSRLNSWNEVADKISSRLSNWKLKTLSIRGRLTLLKSVCTATPFYHMSLYKAPVGILNRMESIRRDFFNKVDTFKKKIAWVGWEKNLASKKNRVIGKQDRRKERTKAEKDHRDTENKAVRLMIFPLSLTREAKTWLDELNKRTIETWDELRTAFISRFFTPALFDRLLEEIRAVSQHENESVTDAWLRLGEYSFEGTCEKLATILLTYAEYFTNHINIDVIGEILEEDFHALLDKGSEILNSIEGTILEEKLFVEFDEFMAMTVDENFESEFDTEEPPFEKITFNTDYKIKTSLEEPPTNIELKTLPDNLEYALLEEPSFLLVIISSRLSEQKKIELVSVLKIYKQAFAWKTIDIPRI
ncbi:reverse transcriptase domain-containing protein [Tanacetum coccineum]